MSNTDNASDRPKRGRPPKGDGMKAHPIHLYFADGETVSFIKEAAEHEGQALSAWARGVLLREARRVLDRAE
jgi:hypothetical protein